MGLIRSKVEQAISGYSPLRKRKRTNLALLIKNLVLLFENKSVQGYILEDVVVQFFASKIIILLNISY